jgi:hypothetical protein
MSGWQLQLQRQSAGDMLPTWRSHLLALDSRRFKPTDVPSKILSGSQAAVTVNSHLHVPFALRCERTPDMAMSQPGKKGDALILLHASNRMARVKDPRDNRLGHSCRSGMLKRTPVQSEARRCPKTSQFILQTA